MDSKRSQTGPAKVAPVSGTIPRPVRTGEAVEEGRPSYHEVERVMGHLDRALDDLRVEFEKFFSGSSKLPPEPARADIQRQLRLLRVKNLRSTAEQFRLGALEARFNSFNEMFNRRLRDHEEGRALVRSAPPPPRPRAEPPDSVVVGARTDRTLVAGLLDELRRRGAAAGSFDLDRFTAYLEQQASSIRARTGCDAVQFRLAEEDGKVKLKARPLADAGV